MAHIVENAWQPVKVGGKRGDGGAGAYTINNFAVSTSWYNTVLDNSGNRATKMRRYEEADCTSVEISRALDILAEDISSCNADNEDIFDLQFPDDSKIKKTHLKILKNALNVWSSRTKFDERMFERVRYVLKNGIMFFRRNADSTLSHLPTERFVGYILSENDENCVTHYLYNENLPRIDSKGRTALRANSQHIASSGNQQTYERIDVDDLLILKIGEGPFGKSIIDSVYKVWKQMTMMEDAIIIYRVVRAPERRVYYIDVGNLQGPKRDQAVNKQRQRLMQKRVSKNNAVETEYDPHSTGEDIFIPTNSTGKGSRIETLPAGQNLGEITDMEWFSKKLAAGLRIPQSMIDGNNTQDTQFSDARVGQLYQAEFRYLGHVKRMKQQIRVSLEDDYRRFCSHRGVNTPREMDMTIADSMSFASYKDLELNQSKLNVFNSTLQIGAISQRFALQEYLGMTHEELIINEDNKLMEKGLSPDQIKDLEPHVRENIVYGDGRLGETFGLEATQPRF